jgi:hypothetical protein
LCFQFRRRSAKQGREHNHTTTWVRKELKLAYDAGIEQQKERSRLQLRFRDDLVLCREISELTTEDLAGGGLGDDLDDADACESTRSSKEKEGNNMVSLRASQEGFKRKGHDS